MLEEKVHGEYYSGNLKILGFHTAHLGGTQFQNSLISFYIYQNAAFAKWMFSKLRREWSFQNGTQTSQQIQWNFDYDITYQVHWFFFFLPPTSPVYSCPHATMMNVEKI